MELPHLTLHFRRLRRLSAKGTLALAIGWLVVVLLWPWASQAFFPDASDYPALAILLLGKTCLYWIIAESMGRLAREGRGREPMWYTSTMSSSAALLSTVSAALLAAVPALIGMLAFMPFAMYAITTSSWAYDGVASSGFAQLGLNVDTGGVFIVFIVLKIAGFALYAGCVHLALRSLPIAGAIAPLLAISTALLGLWGGGTFYYNDEADFWAGSLFRIVMASLAIFAGLLMLLKAHSEQSRSGPGVAATAFGVLGVPLLLGVAVSWSFFLQGWSGGYYSDETPIFLLPVHATAALILPDVSGLYEGDGYSDSWDNSSWSSSSAGVYHLYGWPGGGWAIALDILLIALAGALLWLMALRCLDAARHPAWLLRRPRQAKPEPVLQ